MAIRFLSRFVDTYPEWGKKLEGKVSHGVTVVTFRARSPNSNLNEICRLTITVKEQQPPEVAYCPESFEVQLEDTESARVVYWKEPTFKSHGHLKQVYKSKQPGQKFAPGVHYISYVASDADGLSSKCNFKVTVKGD